MVISISKSSVNFGGGDVRLLAALLCPVSSLLACLIVSMLITKWKKLVVRSPLWLFCVDQGQEAQFEGFRLGLDVGDPGVDGNCFAT
jgi:hypothetical protein